MAGFMYSDQGFLRREKPVDMDNLPQKCCAKCVDWIQCNRTRKMTESGIKEIFGHGLCCRHSGETEDDWDAFTWADDCCDDFELDEDEDDAQPSESDIGVDVQESCGKDMHKKPEGPNILRNWCTGE